MPRTTLRLMMAILFAGAAGVPAAAHAQGDLVVRAVLFFSPTCPHCHQVINEDLPVIFDNYGGQPRVWVDQSVPRDEIAFYYITNGRLEILLVDASKPMGGEFYNRTTARFDIPPPRSGVPRLVVGDSVLVGSLEIPQIFPRIIQAALADQGLDWPDIEGLESVVPMVPPAQPVVAQAEDSAAAPAADSALGAPRVKDSTAAQRDSAPAAEPSPSDTAGQSPQGDADSAVAAPPAVALPAESSLPADSSVGAPSTLGDIPVSQASMLDNFRQDPVANTVAVIVLALMIVSMLIVGSRAPEWRIAGGLGLAIPGLAAAGIVVAGYLTWVETTGALAVCGPVGDCNAVQQSPYATLFGVVPVGLLGLVSYVVVIGAWLVARRGARPASDWAHLALLAIAFVGTLFSIYLTFLEPFVIGATCAWCLTSSVIITALLWLTAAEGTAAFARLTTRGRRPSSGTP